jgi:hypothetical protein
VRLFAGDQLLVQRPEYLGKKMKKSKEITASRNTYTPVTLPPGKYWIGDLCYVMESRWGDFCEKLQTHDGTDHNGEIEIEGLKLWYHFTELGDGIFPALKNTLPNAQVPDGGFFVDAGLIGIVPFDLTDSSSADYSSGVTVTFANAVICSYQDGLFQFKSGRGELVINCVLEFRQALWGHWQN